MIFLSSLGGIKQKFQEFKSSFQALINDLRLDMERKFENTNGRLQELHDHLRTIIVDQMNDHTIIDLSKEDNAQLTNKFELLDKKLTEVQIPCSNLEQYIRRNNIEIQCIPSQIPDEKLKENVTEIFGK